MKLTKGKVIGALAILVILAAAFWYGGNAPGLQGWTVGVRESSPVLESIQPSQTPEETGKDGNSPEPTETAGALETPASPGTPKPSETPAPTESAAPETPTPSPEGLASRPGGLEGGMTAEEKLRRQKPLRAAPPPVWKRETGNTQKPTAWRSIRRLERTSILQIRCRRESPCRWSRRMWSSLM